MHLTGSCTASLGLIPSCGSAGLSLYLHRHGRSALARAAQHLGDGPAGVFPAVIDGRHAIMPCSVILQWLSAAAAAAAASSPEERRTERRRKRATAFSIVQWWRP